MYYHEFMDTLGGIPVGDQTTVIPDSQTSLMERWDALDEEIAKLKSEADQKLFELITKTHEWITKQNLPWLVAGSDGKFAVNSSSNIYHFKTTAQDGIERMLEFENHQTYVGDGQFANAKQVLWENNLLIKSFNGDPLSGGVLRGAVRIRYRLDGLKSVDDMLDALGSVAFYPPSSQDFDQSCDRDEYTVADIVYDQNDNMVDMVRVRQTDVSQRRDPFVETENTMQMLAKAQLLGRFDPYTKERLSVENTPQAIGAQTQ